MEIVITDSACVPPRPGVPMLGEHFIVEIGGYAGTMFRQDNSWTWAIADRSGVAAHKDDALAAMTAAVS